MNRVLTLEEVRAVLADKSCAGHTDAVRALLHKHGAEKLSEIDPAVYPALLQDAEALKAHPRRAGRVAVGKGRCNMKLTEAERLQVAAAIKHFEALQKRYTKQHNGTACEHVKMALIGLDRLTQEPEVVRCGECVHAKPIPDAKAKYFADWVKCCEILRGDETYGVSVVWDEGYCDEGKRRKEQEDG